RSVGPSEVECLHVVEVNDRGDRIAGVLFDPDDLDAAYAELDDRYLAGEAAPCRATWDAVRRLVDGFAKRDWERVASAFAPDFTLKARRHFRLLGQQRTPEEYVTTIRALVDVAPDAVMRLDHVLALDEHRALYIGRLTGASGDTFEIPFVCVATFAPDGRYRRLHAYDLDQLDAARASYDELGARPLAPRIENAATRSVQRWAEARQAP